MKPTDNTVRASAASRCGGTDKHQRQSRVRNTPSKCPGKIPRLPGRRGHKDWVTAGRQLREQQIGSLPASPEVTTAWTRAPESPTAELAGCRIPKAQNPRLRIPIPKLLLGRKFSAGLSAWSVRPRPTLCFELIESLNPTYNPTSRSSEPQRGRLGRVPGSTINSQLPTWVR